MNTGRLLIFAASIVDIVVLACGVLVNQLTTPPQAKAPPHMQKIYPESAALVVGVDTVSQTRNLNICDEL